MKNIAIIGFGVVGSGVYETIKTNKEILKRNTGEELRVAKVLDIRDFSDHEEKEIFTKDFNDLLNDESIDIVVETMGGVRFAYDYTKQLLEKGKSVVTSNKELVAKHGEEFFRIAKEHNVRYLYEASVGGAIPIIRPIACDVAANDIVEVSGILNGTTNYILTKMFLENDSYDNALKTAQELGYAEKDPTADVDGIDACRKISILMSLVTHRKIDSEKVHTVGIRNLTTEDLTYAAALDCKIKLIGCGFVKNGKVSASVEPMLVPNNSPLSSVEDVFNAALVKGNMAGTLMFYGRGAGMLPTASAVVGDVVDIVRNPSYNSAYEWGESAPENELAYEDIIAKFFICIKEDQLEKAKKEFGDIEIINGVTGVGFVAPKMSIKELDEKLSSIGGAVSRLRFYR